MPNELVAIASYWSPIEAATARGALESAGVQCFMSDDNVASTFIANVVDSIKLLVAAADVERAREVLATVYDDWPSDAETWTCPGCGQPVDARFDSCGACRAARPDDSRRAEPDAAPLGDADEARRRARNPYAAPRSGGTEPTDDDADGQVPDDSRHLRCPDCGQPRTAICPFCQTSGGRFKIAFTFDAERPSEGPAMLICPTCDEPFEAAYLRHCEACGHDFGSGLEAPPVASPNEVEPMNVRVLAIALAGLALIVGLLAYFAMLR
jgi:hypothetical protein